MSSCFWLDCSKSNLSKDQAQPSSSMNMPQSFGTAMGFSLSDTLSMAALPGPSQNASQLHSSEDSIVYLAPTTDTNKCWPIRPTLRNELDTFSVHFYVFFGPNISIPPDRAAVFAINLMPVLDSGGVLNMELKLNMVSHSSFFSPEILLLEFIMSTSRHIKMDPPDIPFFFSLLTILTQSC